MSSGTEPQGHLTINVDPESEPTTRVGSSNSVPPGEAESSLHPEARWLADYMNGKLSMLAPDTLEYGTVFIHKVPEKHRNKNPEAYTPRLVSIGPLHHGQSQLQAMEEHKLKYLNDFLRKFRFPIQSLAEYVRREVALIRGCYEDTFNRNLRDSKPIFSDHDEFPQNRLLEKVILLDGVFIVQLFLKNYVPGMMTGADIVFDNSWVSSDILHDLLLLENQLPLRFVSKLYNDLFLERLKNFLGDNAIDGPPFNDLVKHYFTDVGNTRQLGLSADLHYARHLVEFLAILHMPKHRRRQQTKEFVDCPTATELRDSGVKFLRGGIDLFEVHFDENTGELQIPQLTVKDSTETFFRNLIAFEQSVYHFKYMTSYVILLDSLIDTHKDVDLLVDCEIINNQLGTSEQVAELFNNLHKEFVTDPKEFFFSQQCTELNKYNRDIWHKWKSKCSKWFAMLRRDYFGNPWLIISVIAAFALLVLTIIQAVCSVLQVKNQKIQK